MLRRAQKKVRFQNGGNDRGFSLAEVLIAIAVVSIIGGSVVTIFFQSQAAYLSETDQARRMQEIRIAMDQITRCIRQAGNDPTKSLDVPPVQILGDGAIRLNTDITGSNPSTTGYYNESTGDPDGTQSSVYESVIFRYDSSSKRVFANVGYGEQLLAENITLLRFTYYDLAGNETTDSSQVSRVKVVIVGESERPDMRNQRVRTHTLESDIFLRSQIPQVMPEGNQEI